jgi:PAS domain S-box-containing protein
VFIWRWLKNVPLTDPVERRIAPLFQLVVLFLIITPLLEITAAYALGGTMPLGVIALTLVFQLTMAYCVWTLRRGHFRRATRIILGFLLFAVARGVVVTDLDRSGEILLAFFVPLIVAGLLLNRLTLILTLVISSVIVLLEAASVEDSNHTFGVAIFFIIYATLVSFLLDLLGNTLRTELSTAQTRNTALEQARYALEASSAELVESNQRLITTLKSIGDAVITTNAQGQILLLNDVAEILTGWSQTEAQNKPLDKVFRIINQETREAVPSPVVKVMREGTIVGLANHTLLLTRDGREIPIDDSAAPIRHPDGHLIGVVLVFRDISERYRTEQEREQMLLREQTARLEAERANAAKLQFLGMISHELRTPLTSIKGFSDSLVAPDTQFEPEVQQEFLNIIRDEADKLTELVNQLLDVSSLQSARMAIDPAPHRLADILSIALPQIQQLSAQHQLKIDIPADLPTVKADAQRIAQVIANLVANAVKYSPTHTEIRVSAHEHDEHIYVSVNDQGVGIQPDLRELVFEPFRQPGRKRGGTDGAGLGLTICKGIVEAHGGRIWVEETQEPGTQITFMLPRSDAEQIAHSNTLSA